MFFQYLNVLESQELTMYEGLGKKDALKLPSGSRLSAAARRYLLNSAIGYGPRSVTELVY